MHDMDGDLNYVSYTRFIYNGMRLLEASPVSRLSTPNIGFLVLGFMT